MAYVYRHIRLDKNEPFYIGIATHIKRAYEKNQRKNKIWKSIVAKTEYDIEILFDDLTREQALDKEIELISLYGRIDKKTGTLANLTDGGEGFQGICNKGRKASEETKAKLREAAKKKKPRSRECYEKTAAALRGRPKSEEHKRKLSEYFKGKSNGPWSKEHREKNEKYWLSQIEPIGQYDKNDNLIKVWQNRRYILKELNARSSCLTECLKNYKKTHLGYKWKLLTLPLPFVNP